MFDQVPGLCGSATETHRLHHTGLNTCSGCYIIILMYKQALKPLGFGEWFAPSKNHRIHPREGLGSHGTGQGF